MSTGTTAPLARHPWTPDVDDGHADLASHDTWVHGTPYATLQRMRDEDPVAWFGVDDPVEPTDADTLALIAAARTRLRGTPRP